MCFQMMWYDFDVVPLCNQYVCIALFYHMAIPNSPVLMHCKGFLKDILFYSFVQYVIILLHEKSI